MDETRLKALEELVRQLGERLREAKHLYDSGDDGGRAGAEAAITAAGAFVHSIKQFDQQGLAVPLAAAGAALQVLNQGALPPMLVPKDVPGRRPDDYMRQGTRAYVAATMELLMRAGFGLEEAGLAMARHLEIRSIDTPGYMKNLTWRTVANWRYKLRNRNAVGFEAEVFKEFISKEISFRTTDMATIKRDLLRRLDTVLTATKAHTDSI